MGKFEYTAVAAKVEDSVGSAFAIFFRICQICKHEWFSEFEYKKWISINKLKRKYENRQLVLQNRKRGICILFKGTAWYARTPTKEDEIAFSFTRPGRDSSTKKWTLK